MAFGLPEVDIGDAGRDKAKLARPGLDVGGEGRHVRVRRAALGGLQCSFIGSWRCPDTCTEPRTSGKWTNWPSVPASMVMNSCAGPGRPLLTSSSPCGHAPLACW